MQSSNYTTFLQDTPERAHGSGSTISPDIDMISITVPVPPLYRNQAFASFLGDIAGLSLTLSTEQSKRNISDVPAGNFILTFHPVIISTHLHPNLKNTIITECTGMGLPVYPSTSDRTVAAQARPIDLTNFMCLLSRCNITYITINHYGMKSPYLSSPLHSHSVFIESSDHMEHGYPINTYDISFTCRSETLHTVRIRNSDRVRSNTDVFSILTPLDHRTNPRFNHGGTFKTQLPQQQLPNTPGCLSLSTYSPLHHWLLAVPGKRVAPQSYSAGQDLLLGYDTILTSLVNSPIPVGGLRHEVRVAAVTARDALNTVTRERPWRIQEVLNLEHTPDYFTITLHSYFSITRDLIKAARLELASQNFHFNHHPISAGLPLTPTLEHKLIFGDLKQLFGEATYFGYRTNPIDPSAWWRTRYPLRADQIVPVITINPNGQPPRLVLPDNDTTNALILECRNLNLDANNRCSWIGVTALLNQRLGTNYHKDVIRARYRTLTNRG